MFSHISVSIPTDSFDTNNLTCALKWRKAFQEVLDKLQRNEWLEPHTFTLKALKTKNVVEYICFDLQDV